MNLFALVWQATSKDNDDQHVDLAPIVFGLIQNTNESKTKTTAINTRRIRKIRSNKTVKILLDSGASASIVNHSYVHKKFFYKEYYAARVYHGRDVQHMPRGQR